MSDGETGFVAPRRHPRSLADRLEVLARDPALRQRMAVAARLRAVERFALGPGRPDHFCIFQGHFDSLESMLAALNSLQGKTVAADVPNYSPKGAVLMHTANEAGK